jgi:hypothetical protein
MSAQPAASATPARLRVAAAHTEGRDQILSSHTSELVIALCGPIGSPLHRVSSVIKSKLETEFNYDYCVELRLSEFIEKYTTKAPDTSPYDRTKALIQQGDELREKHGSGVLAELAVSQIALDRQKAKAASGEERYQSRRVCHIIDSIKNQQEFEILKLVYRDYAVFRRGICAAAGENKNDAEQRDDPGSNFRSHRPGLG